MSTQQLYCFKVQVKGMHCASCEVLIERKFKKIDGIERVSVNNANGKAKIYCSRVPSIDELNAAVNADGYSVSLREGDTRAKELVSAAPRKHYAEVAGITAIVIAVYFVLKQFSLLPDLGIEDNMSYGFVFMIGLVAALSTCIAVTGGLLVAVASKYSEAHPDLTGIQKLKPHLYFNAGRIISYTVLGGAVGALGSVLTLSTTLTGVLTIAASLIMIALGFQMLHLFPWMKHIQFKMPKFIAHRIHGASGSEHRAAPFLLGASTFFLPCGFTQALQLYVLSQGSMRTGALTMLVFSLGTLPALMSLSAITSFAKGAFLRYFVKVAGVVVVLLGLLNIQSGMVLAGVNIDLSDLLPKQEARSDQANTVPIKNGKQIAEMKVVGLEYYPHRFNVKAGVPVEWRIDGTRAQGCAQIITLRRLGITKRLSRSGITTIAFTPRNSGSLEFSCTMGMTTPGAKFVVVADRPSPAAKPALDPNLSKCDPRYAECL